MVSVALAMIVPLKHASTAAFAASDVPVWRGRLRGSGVNIAWRLKARKEAHDLHDVSGLSEPYGPDGAMANGRRGGAEIPQPGAAGRLRKTVRPARRGTRANLAKLADL